jgi:hypothetical protein
MTTPPPTTPMEHLNSAIATYSDDASRLYTNVHHTAVHVPPIDPVTDDVKKAQTNLQSAFTQLTTAASMQAEQTDRAGLAAVVKLMQTTADSAETISGLLITQLQAHQPGSNPPTDYYNVVSALTSALGVLAQLSPSQVWTTR